MLMAYIWVGMVAAAVLFGAATGGAAAVSSAVTGGSSAAVELCFSICGAVCLWSGVMEVMRRCGLTDTLSRLTRPLLGRIFPHSFRDAECAGDISANFSANLLGLGNAATPAGIRAAKRMMRLSGGDAAGDELCRLVVMNTASLQLIPATVAAVRAGLGAADAFDILPCVWISSAVSVCVGLGAARLLEKRAMTALIVPLLLLGTGAFAALKGVDVFSAMSDGARDGLKTVLGILPPLVATLTAVWMLRASGALDALASLCAPVLSALGIPPETAALMFLRPVSGSAALAVGSELMASFGPDSFTGRVAAVMLGSTETTLYVVSVYFGAAGVKKTRHAVPAALAADLAGFIMSALTVRLFFGP